MADLLNIGASALLSLQRAINTTGNNIANANTPGYSRQDVLFATTPSERAGNSFVGTGVRLDSIQRSFDQFLATDVQSRTSDSAGLDLASDLSSRLDSLLADPDVGVSPALNGFFDALQGVANNPGSLPERQVLLSEAQVLAQRFQGLDQRLQSFNNELSTRVESSVGEINALASSIGDLNLQISRATASTGGAPNDLLDARDRALEELSAQVGITVVPRNDGAINVMVGNGQSLIVGTEVTELGVARDPTDASRLNVVLANAPAQGAIDRFISGGELGAALDFRASVLDSARRELGLLATGITMTFNEQHRQGIDLDGQPGGDFFTAPQPAVVAGQGNSGTATLNASLVDAAALTGDDYRLDYDGSQWQLSNLQTGASQALGGSPVTVDGVQFDLGGSPAAGDSFLVEPTRQGASLLAPALSDPAAVAAAGAVSVTAGAGNQGQATLGEVAVTPGASPPLPLSLTFDPDALGAGQPGYLVSGAPGGPIAFDPATDASGVDVTLGDLQFRLGGEPVAGDSFNLAANSGGSGDNRNLLALADLQSARVLDGGSASYLDAYGSLVAGVAVSSRQAQSEAGAAAALLEQSLSARDSVQGVNLDEEAANLLRYQQAYQAAAQVISVADTVFQTLLAATRR